MTTVDYDNYPTDYWHKVDKERVCCDLCPQFCTLREGKRGNCFVRKNHEGKIVLTSYGRSSGFCIDPIEKKPLNHFYPGSTVLSFGTAGCNLSCKFCQNWDMSKSREMDTLCQSAMPEKIVLAAKRYGCNSIAFTYNDPVIFFEYANDVAQLAKAHHINAVAVSAGYINEEPRLAFFLHIDAANIDLKGFTEQFYRKLCHGSLRPVLDTLLYLKHETNVWFEITNLIIPEENDSDNELHNMCQWIAENLGDEIPLHFSAFHPDFKMLDKHRTPTKTLLNAREIALSYGLKFVYCGNVQHSESDTTYCPHCNQAIIVRDWYDITAYQVDERGHCHFCGESIAGRFHQFTNAFGRQRIPVKL